MLETCGFWPFTSRLGLHLSGQDKYGATSLPGMAAGRRLQEKHVYQHMEAEFAMSVYGAACLWR